MPKTLFFDNYEYTAKDFVSMFENLTNNGIRYDNDLLVHASTPNNMTITIDKGSCFIDGHYAEFETSTVLNVTANTSGYMRQDRISVRVDTNTQTTDIVIIEGEPSLKPSVPHTPIEDGVYYTTLAHINVGNNVSAITNINIVDHRIVTKIWDDYNTKFSKEDNGYLKLPNGFIIQWGMSPILFNNQGKNYKMITYPVVFPNKILSVQVCSVGNPELFAGAGYTTRLNEFQAWLTSNNYNVPITGQYDIRWFAIGY